MDLCLKAFLVFVLDTADPVIAVEDLDIFVPVVIGITVDEAVVSSLNPIIFDAVTGGDIDLHPVIRHEEMAAPFHDLVRGIEKQIIQIKFQDVIRCEIVLKKFFVDIDGSGNVDAVVPEIEQTDPFGKSERTGIVIGTNCDTGVMQNPAPVQICLVGLCLRGKTAQTDMP